MGTVYSPFGEVPYPDEDAAYDVPAHLSALVGALDAKMVGIAYSKSERDSKFFNAPAGFVCKVVYPPTDPTKPDELIGLYIKTGKAGFITWDKLYEVATDFAEYNLQIVDGYEPRTGFTPSVLQENENFAVLNGALVRSDGGNITSGSTVAYLPSNMVPYRAGSDYATATTYNSSQTAGSSKISISQSTLGIIYYGPSVAWLGLDGVRFRVVNS